LEFFGDYCCFWMAYWARPCTHTHTSKSKVGFGVCTRRIWAPPWKSSAWCLQHLMPDGKAIHAPKFYWFLSSLDCWPACFGATRCTPSMAGTVFSRPAQVQIDLLAASREFKVDASGALGANPWWTARNLRSLRIRRFPPKKHLRWSPTAAFALLPSFLTYTLTVYLVTYMVTFYLTWIQTFYLHLSATWSLFWHSIWGIFIFWHFISHSTWSVFWHFIWHISGRFIWHNIIYIYILTIYLATFWHSIWQSILHSFWHIWHSISHFIRHILWHFI
jgi:hypothetical protein